MIKVTLYYPTIEMIAKEVCCGKAGCQNLGDCQFQRETLRYANPMKITQQIMKLVNQRVKVTSFNVS